VVPPSPRGTGKPGQEGSRLVLQPPGESKLYPDALAVERLKVRLKRGQTEKLRAAFLPFTHGAHYCTVMFTVGAPPPACGAFRDADTAFVVAMYAAMPGLNAAMGVPCIPRLRRGNECWRVGAETAL
jgi:hypothetical protein